MAHILLIEDDASIRPLLQENLTRAGHTVTPASNGREGVALFRPGVFDLVITDLVMPEKEGIEVLQDLRLQEPSLKAIAMSGGGQFGAAETYLRLASLLGAGKVLAKPFTREQFLSAVDETLGGQPAPKG
jgi:DNA-binding NtrC family response regulator